jgi:hypothetical protein
VGDPKPNPGHFISNAAYRSALDGWLIPTKDLFERRNMDANDHLRLVIEKARIYTIHDQISNRNELLRVADEAERFLNEQEEA